MTAPSPDPEAVSATVLAFAESRGAGKTLCPSEVARALAPEHWRVLMPKVREAAETLAREGRVVVTQKGVPVRATTTPGPIRIGLAAS